MGCGTIFSGVFLVLSLCHYVPCSMFLIQFPVSGSREIRYPPPARSPARPPPPPRAPPIRHRNSHFRYHAITRPRGGSREGAGAGGRRGYIYIVCPYIPFASVEALLCVLIYNSEPFLHEHILVSTCTQFHVEKMKQSLPFDLHLTENLFSDSLSSWGWGSHPRASTAAASPWPP